MPLKDAVSAVFNSNVYLIIIGAITALGLLGGLIKGLFKKKKDGDYFISLVIYILTDGFVAFLIGLVLCTAIQYLPSLLGLDSALSGLLK